jgi:hypothetical protein
MTIILDMVEYSRLAELSRRVDLHDLHDEVSSPYPAIKTDVL